MTFLPLSLWESHMECWQLFETLPLECPPCPCGAVGASPNFLGDGVWLELKTFLVRGSSLPRANRARGWEWWGTAQEMKTERSLSI